MKTEPEFSAGAPQLVFEGRYLLDSHPRYSVSPDGQRFLMARVERPNQINVVPNWFEGLNRLVSTD